MTDLGTTYATKPTYITELHSGYIKIKSQKGSRSVFVGQMFVLEAWGTEAKKHKGSGKSRFVGLAAEGGKAKKT